MKLNNTYYAKRRDQILIVANAIIITICAVGSIWGLIRIGELKAEQEKLGAAIEWLELGNHLANQVQRARSDQDHPTRGLIAIADAINAELEEARRSRLIVRSDAFGRNEDEIVRTFTREKLYGEQQTARYRGTCFYAGRRD